jgi:hypothetical protein
LLIVRSEAIACLFGPSFAALGQFSEAQKGCVECGMSVQEAAD